MLNSNQTASGIFLTGSVWIIQYDRYNMIG